MNNKNKYIIALIGGDRRQEVIARELLSAGHKVRIYGLGKSSFEISGAEICGKCEFAICGSDVVLLPLPITKDGINVSMVEGDTVSLGEIISQSAQNGVKVVLGGMIPDEFITMSATYGVKIVDFYKDEALQRKNALPSAEGSLMIAMEHTDKTVFGMKALVCGYGRIGKLLCQILSRLGADVTVAVRRDESLCETSMCGYSAIKTDNIEDLSVAASNSDVIFNTVPHVIFNQSCIEKIYGSPLYVEIASSPGGIDVSCARRKGLQIVFAPSLPGKYAPVNAGWYIFETVTDIIDRLDF